MGGGRPPGRSRGYGVPRGGTNDDEDLIRQSSIAWIDRVGVILLLMRDDIGRKLTEDWVAQHLVFMRRLPEERVGDGAGRVREAGQVRSGS